MSTHLKNITRYTYEDTSFLGWRVAFCRNGTHFTRYFPDRLYGGKEQSLQAALELRELMRRELDRGCDPKLLFQQHSKEKNRTRYAPGLKPPRRKTAAA